MTFIASLFLPFIVAALVAAAGSVAWHGVIAKPALFFTASFFLVLGLHRFAQALLELGKTLWPRGGFFLEFQPKPSAIEALERQLTIESLVLALVVAVLSYPLLAVVRNGFGK